MRETSELSAANLESVLQLTAPTDKCRNISAAITLQLKALLNLMLPYLLKWILACEHDTGRESCNLQPDAVYQLAVTTRPQQKVDELNLKLH